MRFVFPRNWSRLFCNWSIVAPWSAPLFSEGTALYLWQIRYIPNDRQTLLKLMSVLAACGVVAVSLLPATSFVAGQSAPPASGAVATDGKASPAEEFLVRVRQELPKHRSIKAEMIQVVSIGDQQFKIEGEYLSAGQKLKLRYTVSPNQGAQGEMLEICDGQELSTLLKLGDSPRVTQRNVQQILAAKAASQQAVPDAALNAELGLGGLATLLASLERTMTFDSMKTDESTGHSRTILQGRWKPEFAQAFPKDRDNSLPIYIPDLVWITVNSQTLFPEKILYLKKPPQKKLKPIVTLEFSKVEFDGPVDDSAFVFLVPPGVIPEDITKQYVDRLGAPAAAMPPAAAN